MNTQSVIINNYYIQSKVVPSFLSVSVDFIHHADCGVVYDDTHGRRRSDDYGFLGFCHDGDDGGGGGPRPTTAWSRRFVRIVSSTARRLVRIPVWSREKFAIPRMINVVMRSAYRRGRCTQLLYAIDLGGAIARIFFFFVWLLPDDRVPR